MNPGPAIGLAAARAAPAAKRCQTCRHFNGSPRGVEASLPGMRSLGSVYGSVRASDGICRLHGRYLGASSSCAAHEPPVAGE